MNLTELRLAIQQYCEQYETTFTEKLDTFIRNAEVRVFNEVQLPIARKSAVLAQVAPGENAYSLPVDFLSPHSVMFTQNGVRNYLLQKDFEFLLEAYPDLDAGPVVSVDDVGVPQYYTYMPSYGLAQQQIAIAPRPNEDAAFSVHMQYFAMPESITTVVGGQTWLGDNYEGALLWGSVVEGYIFLKGQPDLQATYENKFQQQMAILKELGDGKNRQDTYRVEQTRIPVT